MNKKQHGRGQTYPTLQIAVECLRILSLHVRNRKDDGESGLKIKHTGNPLKFNSILKGEKFEKN